MTVGIIIANTGSPASPEPDAIEAYLREYLMDERIRQLPKPLWKWLLHKHILPKRKYSSAKRYEFIWTSEGSPLIANQQRLVDAVQRSFDEERAGDSAGDPAGAGGDGAAGDSAGAAADGAAGGPAREPVFVRNAMSYGEPSIEHVLAELRDADVSRVVLLPLYPQSAYSPTMAVVDSFHRALAALDWQPDTTIIDNYHDNPTYIYAIADAIRGVGFDPEKGDRLVLSLHAIPLKDEKAGDTYRAQVAKSAELVASELGIDPATVTVSFQSVFGHNKDAWVSPLSLDILESWRDESFRVVYCCMGFAIDCLETLYDIPNEMVVALEGEGAAPTVEHVGADIQAAINTNGRFVWVPTLNDSAVHAKVVRSVLDQALRGE